MVCVYSRKTIIFFITEKGKKIADTLKSFFPSFLIKKFNKNILENIWDKYEQFIFIMATGIVVRSISSLIKNKWSDPAVIVIDESAKYVISLLSGHIGGANKFAKEIATILGSTPIITTATDINNLTSIELWAKEKGLIIENPSQLPEITRRYLSKGGLRVYTEISIDLPEEFIKVPKVSYADIVITTKEKIQVCDCRVKTQLYLRPKNLFIGLGCNSNTPFEEIEYAITKTFKNHNLSLLSIACVSTLKQKSDEVGIKEFVKRYKLPLKSFSKEELNKVNNISVSKAAIKSVGVKAVAEPAAILSSCGGKLIIPKQKIGNVTIAVAYSTKNFFKKGKLFIVGIGPGGIEYIAPKALRALRESEVIVGYNTYIELIKEIIDDKEVYTTGMTKEIERAVKALELSYQGKKVSIISGGDPGIYAIAGAVFEIIKRIFKDNELPFDIEVIPGITGFSASAALVGAPLIHDFACISLSDRLTPWEKIEQRLHFAAKSDFVIVLQNPKSKQRQHHIILAKEIILKYRKPTTPVGIIISATRKDEKIIITDLYNLPVHEIDMHTTVIIGNSCTSIWKNFIITPRGYKKFDTNYFFNI